jgi:hypothetical protein
MPPIYACVCALALHMLAHLVAHVPPAGQLDPFACLPQQSWIVDDMFLCAYKPGGCVCIHTGWVRVHTNRVDRRRHVYECDTCGLSMSITR